MLLLQVLFIFISIHIQIHPHSIPSSSYYPHVADVLLADVIYFNGHSHSHDIQKMHSKLLAMSCQCQVLYMLIFIHMKMTLEELAQQVQAFGTQLHNAAKSIVDSQLLCRCLQGNGANETAPKMVQ